MSATNLLWPIVEWWALMIVGPLANCYNSQYDPTGFRSQKLEKHTFYEIILTSITLDIYDTDFLNKNNW